MVGIENIDRTGATLPSQKSFSKPAMGTLVFAMAFQVGTGGLATDSYYSQKGDIGYSVGYSVVQNPEIAQTSDISQERNADTDLQLIRDFLRPSVSELAAAFGVSRQAIYDWQNGKNIADNNRERVAELAEACELLVVAEVGSGHELLRRKISEGQNLIEQVAAGVSGADAANALINILTTEKRQRLAVSNRLSARGKQSVDFSDAGLPSLSEDG